ncbi:glycosyltransferase family 2 protein [Hallella multisaccharivorax]|uniref:Glycosyl transferase family 2 n=1 Tax=Hallella multisaccharivorax DSM 17128 TaxID=688246 RepID=F8N5U7_9BACT|nr:glycosyltransferase [Hallella multisaccharivorax]EGN56109.1 glycosyl transferase family 2 [Hallella multisaccharivorax DSM 17128]
MQPTIEHLSFNNDNADGRMLFSILIPSWNNLPFLQLCIRSIREHSAYRHQIIVHINEGKDGTLEWVKAQGLDYTYSRNNVGVCLAMNIMRTKVKTDYILFLNDDMYLLPGWDVAFYDEVRKLNSNYFYLSASTIQPHHHPGGLKGWQADYGDRPDNFQEQRLLNEFSQLKLQDWQGATCPPSLVHRDIWDLVGGYSIEFTPGMGSDPDFTAKLLFVGVRYFKGLAASRAYHFECKTTAVVKKNKYLPLFFFKWRILNSTIRNYLTYLGKPWIEEQNKHPHGKLWWEHFRGRMKAIFYAIKGDYGVLNRIDDEDRPDWRMES